MEPVAIVSNHRDSYARGLDNIPFHHLPVTPGDQGRSRKPGCSELIARHGVDLVVLARYMQILSEELAAARGPRDQHPPLVPASVQGREALPPGVRRAASS